MYLNNRKIKFTEQSLDWIHIFIFEDFIDLAENKFINQLVIDTGEPSDGNAFQHTKGRFPSIYMTNKMKTHITNKVTLEENNDQNNLITLEKYLTKHFPSDTIHLDENILRLIKARQQLGVAAAKQNNMSYEIYKQYVLRAIHELWNIEDITTSESHWQTISRIIDIL